MVRYDKSVAFIDRKLETGNKLKSPLNISTPRKSRRGQTAFFWITDDPAVFTDSKEIDGVKVVSRFSYTWT
ncbi:MAG: hypothetical protein U0744_18400 [Gemmataceae bacterium]